MKGPIRRITRERREDRSDATVPTAWLGNGHQGGRSRRGGTWLTEQVPAWGRTDGVPVLVMLGADAEANTMLVRHAANCARVYALVGPETDLQGLHAPNVLARRVAEVPASAVYSSTDARAWIGGGISLKLDGQQAEALRQTFLRLFWHEATDEAWLDRSQFVWRPARERPFDVPEVPALAAVRWEPPGAQLSVGLRGARVHLTGGEPPAIAPRQLWFKAGAEHHARLATLTRGGTEVIWGDLELPDLVLGDAFGEALLPGTRGRLRIRLTAAQSKEAVALLDVDAAWRVGADGCIGDPKLRRASFWLAGEASARAIEDEQIVDVSSMQATSLRDILVTDPSSVPPPQPLALSVRYRWPVVPPRIPVGSEEDQLVKRWRSLDDEWIKRLAAVRDALENSDGERSRLGTAFSRLLSGLLGFERTHKELLAAVTALGSERPSKAGPGAAPALLSRLDKLEDAAKKHQVDLDDAERKAREEQEQEKQRAEWAAQLDRAKRDAEQARKELAREEKRESELAEEANEIEARSKDATPEEKKDLDVKKRRNSDDRTLNEKALKKLRYDLRKREDEAARPFTFNAAKLETKGQQPQGKRFVPTSTGGRASNNVPDDALPEVGLLRTHKGQRYLVIDVWEHLDAGEQAATRLSAKLVAREDA